MTTAFQVAIDKIRDQQHILWELDERAVEVGVILPSTQTCWLGYGRPAADLPPRGF